MVRGLPLDAVEVRNLEEVSGLGFGVWELRVWIWDSIALGFKSSRIYGVDWDTGFRKFKM